MNSNRVRTNRIVLDGWPILVAFAMYLLAFGVFAMTMVSGVPLA
jgi:hypothetical protein